MEPLPLPPGTALVRRWSQRPEGEVVEVRRGEEHLVLRLGRGEAAEARTELALLAGFRHPRVAPLVDHGPLAGGGLFLARPFVEGEDLERWLRGHTAEEAVAVLVRLVEPLVALHQAGFVHGDLKPSNVLVDDAGEPVLVDFGLAGRAGAAEEVVGTDFYLAPEVLLGGPRTPAADAFAFGVMLQRLLAPSGTTARDFYARFPGRPFLDALGTSVEELPEWSRDLVVGLTARFPERRPSLAAVGRTLATRLGLAPPATGETPWIVPDLLGREAWFDERLRHDLARGDDAPPSRVWWVAPAEQDARALFRAVHLRLSLRNAHEAVVDLARFGALRDAAALARHAEHAAASLVGFGGVLSTAADTWRLRALEVLEGATRVDPSHHGLVVVATHEPPSDRWTRVDVPPLDLETLAAYLAERVRTDATDFARRLHEAAGGSLDGLSRVLVDAHERGAVLVTADGWELSEAHDLRPAVEARLTPSDPDEHALLEVLGLAREPLSLDALVRTLDRDARTLGPALARLAARRAVDTDDDGRVSSRVALPTTPTARRPQVLARLADVLEEAGDPTRAALLRVAGGGAHVEDLVAHLERERELGAPERVLAAVDELASSLGETGAVDPAVELLAIEAWLDLGRTDRAHARLEALPPLATAESRGRALLARARHADLTHRTDEALELLDRAEHEAPGLAGLVHAQRVFLHGRRGEDERVLELADGGTPDAGLTPRAAATLRSTVAMSRFRRGEVQRAREELHALLHELRTADVAGRTAGVELNLALVERRSGSLERAVEHLRAAHEAFRSLGDVRGVAHARATLGGVLRECGELREAERELEAALDLRRRLGDERGVLGVRAALALVALDAGHARSALDELARVREEGAGELPRGFLAFLGAREVELRARLGEPPSAARRASEAEGADPRALVALARAHAIAGRVKPATELAERARDLAHSLKQGVIAADARQLLAEVGAGEPVEPTELGPLAADDARVAAFLAQGAELDVPAATALAAELERRGRDDRAARLWFALAARGERTTAVATRARAERVLERAGAGLDEARAASFRDHLLGRPDPAPSDLTEPARAPDGALDDMAIQALRRINDSLLASDDLGTLFQSVVQGAMSLTGAERGFLVLEEDGVLHFDLALDSALGGIARPELETSRTIVQRALDEGHSVRLSNAADEPETASQPSVVGLELRSILCVPFEVPPDARGVLVLDHRLRTGAFDARAEELAELVAGTAALAIQKIRQTDAIGALTRRLESRLAEREEELAGARRALAREGVVGTTTLIGNSPRMRVVRERIARIAPSDLPVLIVGPSGTGKELAARALFEMSPRRDRPFVAENCAALPASLIESELFGHRKGSFTGADRDHAGLFERAHGGTLFLDEVGELPLELQSRLLRVLENGELRRVGDDRVRQVDVRLLTATNRDLEREVEEGRFRRDLLYRLDGARIAMPSLEERRQDVPELVRHFLDLHASRTGRRRRISSAVLDALVRRPWPGNVRELRNEVERLCVLAGGDVEDPSLVREAAPSTGGVEATNEAEVVPLAELERRAILAALEACGGDKREAAKRLGISRAKVYQRLKEWGEA